MEIDEHGQIAFDGTDTSEEAYKNFTEKFEPKKTTDDCLTPPAVYDAVAGYVSARYGIPRERFARPFWPGVDYEAFEYPPDCAVVDNPPFSILTKIMRFYQDKGIPFFLFAPGLVFSGANQGPFTLVAAGATVVYENGANVMTSFATNMEPDVFARADPELHDLVRKANEESKPKGRKLRGNIYPNCLLTASDLNYMAQHGVPFAVDRKDAFYVRKLESQSAAGRAIYGGGALLSNRAAAERAAAERAAAERAAAERTEWELSEKERNIIRKLSGEDLESAPDLWGRLAPNSIGDEEDANT